MSIKLKNKLLSFKKNILISAISLCLPCSLQAENFVVLVPGDDGAGTTANTLSWAIWQANSTPGDDVITLSNHVNMYGVMKRLIDSNVTIQSDARNKWTISGRSSYRPLFIKSGEVTLSNFNMEDGLAKGGAGAGGGGMGGSLFIYDGEVNINNVSFESSEALEGESTNNDFGGGGMFGDGEKGGGGMFTSASGSLGAVGGYYGNFGHGGTSDLFQGPVNGYFGGGGANEGDGGFGAGAGRLLLDSSYHGEGGFGGGSGSNYSGYNGFGATKNGSGLGGAIFIRSGTVNIRNSDFSYGLATNFGAGIFIVHRTTNSNANNIGMPDALATVVTCNLTFNNNQSMSIIDPGTANNNDDIFDLGDRMIDVGECPIFKGWF